LSKSELRETDEKHLFRFWQSLQCSPNSRVLKTLF
jgi:hypothetical protein